MVCTGETYSAEIVQGTDLLEKILEALCGDDADAKAADHEFYEELLDVPENWGFDGDRLEPTIWITSTGACASMPARLTTSNFF